MHLPDRQFLVQPVCPGQEQQFATTRFEEFRGQADEPVLPEGLRGGKVGAPGPLLPRLLAAGVGVGGRGTVVVAVVEEQGRDGDAGGGAVADGAGADVPFDAGGDGREGGWARREVCFHAAEGVEGGACAFTVKGMLGLGWKGRGALRVGKGSEGDATDLRRRRGHRSRVGRDRGGAHGQRW